MENLPGYLWWKKRKRAEMIKMAIMIIAMDIIVFWALSIIGFNSFKRADLLFGGFVLLFFLVYGLYKLVLLIKSYTWKIDKYWYGVITGMYQTRHPNRRIKDSRIIATVNGKSMEGICLSQTYQCANIGDEVFLFTLGDDVVMAVHPHM